MSDEKGDLPNDSHHILIPFAPGGIISYVTWCENCSVIEHCVITQPEELFAVHVRDPSELERKNGIDGERPLATVVLDHATARKMLLAGGLTP